MADAHSHPALAHHFDSLEQQQQASQLGMWVFLATEVMFFGGLFLAYVLYRALYPDAFTASSHHLDVTLGAFNTAVLIGSSLTMALGVRAAQTGGRKAIVWWVLATIVLGSIFLGVKAVEYSHKFHEHLIPGAAFQFEPVELLRNAQIFFSLYFAMTGMHALHMVIGIGLLGTIAVMAWRGRFSAEYNTPVEMVGLYWHFVDIVWIVLFPLLYLLGRH